MKLLIDNIEIAVRPSEEHEYLIENSLVAKGYGVTPDALRMQKQGHLDELIEGKHWVKGVTNTYATSEIRGCSISEQPKH